MKITRSGMRSPLNAGRDDQTARRLGAFTFVTKPFDVGEIVGFVRDAWAAA